MVVLYGQTKSKVHQCTLVVIIQVESCEKLSAENIYELMQFFFQISVFKSLHAKQIMVVRQNVLSTIMLQNVKLSNENIKLQLGTPEIC